ncbi:hypothetical protein TNCV_4578481 [Trichonephila clavipes]|nr:hypothetical protein TNCV_4578481 [Trichonephila clavipes]
MSMLSSLVELKTTSHREVNTESSGQETRVTPDLALPFSKLPLKTNVKMLSIVWSKGVSTRLSECVSENINVAVFLYKRVFGNGPRNFEPWSSDEDGT